MFAFFPYEFKLTTPTVFLNTPTNPTLVLSEMAQTYLRTSRKHGQSRGLLDIP